MVTRNHIQTGLRTLGLRQGDAVVVHSSLSSFGRVEGGAKTVVEAVLTVIGEAGTLVVPTFTVQVDCFDPAESPSLVGAISETVRLRPGAVRSSHPTHSVTAIGPLADALTDNTEDYPPFGRGSAFFRLLQVNGRILLLGTDHTTNSMIHVAEELASVAYLDRQRQVRIKDNKGNIKWKWVRKPGCSKGFIELEDALNQKGAVSEITIGDCRAKLMTARAVVDTAVEALRFDQEALLCDLPDCEPCAQARAMISALEIERQDREITQLAEEEERTRRFVADQLEGEVRYYERREDYHSPN